MKKIALFIFLFVGFQSVKAQDSINSDNNLTDKVQVMPQYIGGLDSLFSYLKQNTIYPKSAKDKNLEGTVYVTFVVSQTGSITKARILSGVKNAPELDAEALRVVKAMPKWIPGKQDGKNVNVQFSIPIKFILNDADTSAGNTFTIVQQMPVFVWGQDSLNHYLEKSIIYPPSAKKKNKEGTVYVSFVVSETGTIRNIKIVKGVEGEPELDAEALRVAKSIPNDWIAGKQDGAKVNVQLTLPIKFILDDAEKKK